jgi:deoxyribodipyrimidine photo-lyase
MGSKLKPRAFIHEPYKMTYLDQKFNDFEVGVNYPYCEYGRTRNSLVILWKMKKMLVKKKMQILRYTMADIGDEWIF